MWDPIIEGCTTSTACNYNPEAKKDDNSCISPLGCDNWCPSDTTEVKELDCAGVCGGLLFIDCSGQCGILVIDECGVCGGNNTICKDCNGVVNGEAEYDKCGDCVDGDTGLEACTPDCLGIWGGSAALDECGVCDGLDNYVSGTCNDCAGIPNGTAYTDGCSNCVGGNTGLEECGYDCAGTLGGELIFDECGVCDGDNSTCTDCHGDINGTAYLDGCQDCVGGNTGEIECTTDCADVFGGTSFYDNCGICVPEGDTTCIQGCDGIWKNDGTQLVLDECEVCGGNNLSCIDCAGNPNGSAILDNCEECVSAGDTSCVKGCDGYWVNDGTQLVLDECNICGGDNTVCAGCDGIPNSGLEIDVCGVCGGDGTCLPENCTDDNVSGYCQDLSVLQDFIDNSSGTLNMEMDENGDGVIEPLELGEQTWLDGRLISLSCFWFDGEFNYCQLSGEIPSEIDNLTSLTYLNLWNNQLTGEIPAEIGNLLSLTFLALSINELTGEIPSEIGNLTSLAELSFWNNQLTGEIPPEIGNLTNLTQLFLRDNQLTGEIPSEIGDLTSLTHLALFNNELSGEIPSEIGNLTNLTQLSLHSNQLSGEIPSSIGNLTNLAELYLYYNELTGEIPSEIGDLTSLTHLALFNNELSGEIPSEIGNLTNLTQLSLHSNQLSGEIPSEICNQGDSSPSLSNNQLCPPYPDCLTEEDIEEQDTSECPETTVTDYDGNTYEIVQIGDQLWMAENLKVTHYNNGDEIPSGFNANEWTNLTIGAYEIYNNDPLNTDIYGNLYNWYTVDEERVICPESWHIPTNDDWTNLFNYIAYRGGKMKEVGTDHWNSPNTGATNESRFTALPGGFRNSGHGLFEHQGETGNFWSTTPFDSTRSYALTLWAYMDAVFLTQIQKQYGFSIRCLAD